MQFPRSTSRWVVTSNSPNQLPSPSAISVVAGVAASSSDGSGVCVSGPTRMTSPLHDRIPAGSDPPPLMESGDKENVFEDRGIISECPTLHRERKKRHVGFNLRKSIAWNPAFFTEEGVLDNMELSVLSGSQMKSNRSPGAGAAAATASPVCRFGRSGSASVLKEVAENSRGKLPAKYRCTESKGRKLFSPAKTSERDEWRELAGIRDKRSERSTQKCIPRPPAGYAQKMVSNSSAAAQLLRTPKKSQPSIPTVPRSTSFATSISQPNKKLPPAPVKTGHRPRVDGLLLKSKIKPTSLAKSSGPKTDKDVAPAVTAIRPEAGGSVKYGSFSTHLQNSPSSSIHVIASTLAKPSALRMPSPSVGFFAQGKAPVSHCDTAVGNANSCFTGNTSSFLKPPRYKQPKDIKGRICQHPVSHGDTAQGNAKDYFTGNTPSLVKPLRYKQPEDLQSRLCLTKQMSTDSPADSKPLVHPVTNESPLSTLTSSLPGLEHDNVCSAKESLLKGIITYSAKSRNTINQQIRNTDCFSAGGGDTTQPLSLEKNRSSRNGVPNAYSNASHAEGKGSMSRIEPIENSLSLRAICSSSIEPVEDSCYHDVICSSTKPIVGSKLSFSCISSQVCTLDDLNCQSKSDNCATVANDLENSLSGQTMVATSLSEGNNCTPGPDLLRYFHSCDQQNTESSALVESVESTSCADWVPPCGSSIDIKLALADSTSDLYGSLCNEAQPTSAEEPNTDGRVEPDSDNSLITKEAQLLNVGSEFEYDYGSSECSPTKPASPMPCVDQEIPVAHLNDSETVTIDSKTDSYDSLAVGRQPVLSEEPNTEDNMELDTNDLSALENASPTEKNKPVEKSGTNTIRKDHLKQLVPFTEEWLAAMEACGEEVLKQKTGAVQNSPTDKTAPESSPWSPVKRKAQDVGPFDCTKYSKSVRTSDTP